jgi:capsular polysaccharide biosynthesis protein
VDALRLARTKLREAIAGSAWSALTFGTPTIIFARRGAVSMRSFDEVAFQRALEEAVEAAFGANNMRVVAIDGAKTAFGEALASYAQATAIVGAHGGALTNTIVCAEGTPVIEIGYRSPAAQHYHHMANALGLPYTRIRVAEDSLKRALSAPTIVFDQKAAVDAVIAAVKAAQAKKSGRGPAYLSADL